MFWDSFRFAWGYEWEDAWEKEEGGLYRYSETLEKEVRKLGNFCMEEAFLREFPELRADIGEAKGMEGGKRRGGSLERRKERRTEGFGDGNRNGHGNGDRGRGGGGLEELELLSAGLLGGEGYFA
jgi:hypothetical protein